MTRKLHNTLMAVITSSSLLVVGLVASSPIASEVGATDTANVLAMIDPQEKMSIGAIDDGQASPSRRTRAARHNRQSPAMPFFSFAPRS